MSNCRIMEACRFAGVTLTRACELADVKYGTLYNQIKFGREIPFSTIAKISAALDIPLPFFAGGETDNPIPESSDQWGNAASANSQRGECTRAGFAINTDTVLDWFHKHGGRLENWQWFSDQVDLFHPLEPTDKLMRPIKIGKRSLTAERLMLSGNRDYYKVVGKFSKARIDRAMMSHKAMNDMPYLVTDEVLDANIKGVRVLGGYRKVTMRLTDPAGSPVNATFSKLTWLNHL